MKPEATALSLSLVALCFVMGAAPSRVLPPAVAGDEALMSPKSVLLIPEGTGLVQGLFNLL